MIKDISIENNSVLCDGCGKLEKGIYFRDGNFKNISVKRNQITATGNAFRVGRTDAAVSMVDALIEKNHFLDSTDRTLGQIALIVTPEQIIEAKISKNFIKGGAGWAIFCRNNGELSLTDLMTNVFSDNQKNDLSGSCL